MKNNYKPGGGNKPQPYIPAGNGEKSGEYTNKSQSKQKSLVLNCFVKNIKMKCNFYNSSLVKDVKIFISVFGHVSIKSHGKPNSVIKIIRNGYVVSERYYNERGEAYLDIDYTCHGNPKRHPVVPHIHRWYRNKENVLKRNIFWEDFE